MSLAIKQTQETHGVVISLWGNRLFTWALPLTLALVALGCGPSEMTNVDRVSVSGSVTLDGKPLQAGAIVFHGKATGNRDSSEGAGETVTAFGFIENGSYSIVAAEGPTIGPARVEFRPKPLPRGEMEDALDEAAKQGSRRPPRTSIVQIPDRYGSESTLKVQLAKGTNVQDFALKSRP